MGVPDFLGCQISWCDDVRKRLASFPGSSGGESFRILQRGLGTRLGKDLQVCLPENNDVNTQSRYSLELLLKASCCFSTVLFR